MSSVATAHVVPRRDYSGAPPATVLRLHRPVSSRRLAVVLCAFGDLGKHLLEVPVLRRITALQAAHAFEHARVNAFMEMVRLPHLAFTSRPRSVERSSGLDQNAVDPRLDALADIVLIEAQSARFGLPDHPLQGDIGEAAVPVAASDIGVRPGEPDGRVAKVVEI